MPLGEAENGTGQRFVTRDGQAELRVWGFTSAMLDTTLKIEYREAGRSDTASHRVVTAKELKDNAFVVSGFEGHWCFHRKMIYKDGVFKNLFLQYPREQAAFFDPVAARLLAAFKD
ncbi:hypothetical protein GKIL_0304 [Gloeobacter kilaueensis JS1]|uniref:Uncharacterized protein n=1 Tax=Gloeobacter kilaueensis (strain ATCC BAA-2537 / CCAP 1431/1 / ULC 316 / JS1) TaxID=1183438 RepID=U5QCF7_GLOK1|nr:hypothetical protein GKIL_0304 [Gloeobacter kilaueensis JS1]